MTFSLEIEELRAIIEGRRSYRKCPACQGRGLNGIVLLKVLYLMINVENLRIIMKQLVIMLKKMVVKHVVASAMLWLSWRTK